MDYETLEDFEDAPDGQEWRIEWSNGGSRTTTIHGLAWWAHRNDPEAEVTPL